MICEFGRAIIYTYACIGTYTIRHLVGWCGSGVYCFYIEEGDFVSFR